MEVVSYTVAVVAIAEAGWDHTKSRMKNRVSWCWWARPLFAKCLHISCHKIGGPGRPVFGCIADSDGSTTQIDLRSRKRSYLAQRRAPRICTSGSPGPRTTGLTAILVRPIENPVHTSISHSIGKKIFKKRTGTLVLCDNSHTSALKGQLEASFDHCNVPS